MNGLTFSPISSLIDVLNNNDWYKWTIEVLKNKSIPLSHNLRIKQSVAQFILEWIDLMDEKHSECNLCSSSLKFISEIFLHIINHSSHLFHYRYQSCLRQTACNEYISQNENIEGVRMHQLSRFQIHSCTHYLFLSVIWAKNESIWCKKRKHLHHINIKIYSTNAQRYVHENEYFYYCQTVSCHIYHLYL